MISGKCHVILATKGMPGLILDSFRSEAVTIFRLNNKSQLSESEILSREFPEAEHIIIDGYEFDVSYQMLMRKMGLRVIVIDDLGGNSFDADIIINHSPGATITDYNVSPDTKCCLGLEYAFIDQVFFQKINVLQTVGKNRVFLNMGGGDPLDITSKILTLLYEVDPEIEVNLVIGGLNQHKDKLIKYAKESNGKIHDYYDLSSQEMASLMQKSVFGICTASTVAIEACATHLPIMIGWVVDNQQSIYKGMIERELAIGVEYLEELNKEKFNAAITQLRDDIDFRVQMSKRQQLSISKFTANNIYHCIFG